MRDIFIIPVGLQDLFVKEPDGRMIMIISFGRPAFETLCGEESIDIFDGKLGNLLPGTLQKVPDIVAVKIDR